MVKDTVLSDDLLIRLIQVHYEHNQKIDAMEKVGIKLDALRIDVLTIALDGMGIPPEDQLDDDLVRDWIYVHYVDIVENGSFEEIQQFLVQVRHGLRERGLGQTA